MSQIMDIYQDILDVPDILSAVSKYIAYVTAGFYYDFGYTIIPKGTKLYRIRKYIDGTDFSRPCEWGPSPYKQQNRCNKKGETAIYFGSTEPLCLLETDIAPNEQYALGEYEVIKDIKIGGFIYIHPNESKWKIIVGMLFNSFLVAPSRSLSAKEVFDFLDNLFDDKDFSKITLKDVYTPPQEMLLPFRIGSINQKDKYYNITNSLCDTLKLHYPSGIRYSSCWLYRETVGIEFNYYNLVLYSAGLSSVRFVKSEIKRNTHSFSRSQVVKLLLERFTNSKIEKCERTDDNDCKDI